MAPGSQTVLITGCSSGIGRDLAQQLTRSGFQVIATARDVTSLADLEAALKLPLDVTSPESIIQAVERTYRQFGSINVLVNNAGYAVRGVIEEVPIDQVQRMFETNVFGVMRMVQAVLPHMRLQKEGRIINVGSFAGKLAVPVNGAYSAAKFSLEALSDALRLELSSFGIQVVLIEPGNIRTHFMETSQSHSGAALNNPDSPYYQLNQHYLQTMVNLRRGDPGPEVVSQIIRKAIIASRPKARYLVAVPFTNRLLIYLNDALRDSLLKRVFRI